MSSKRATTRSGELHRKVIMDTGTHQESRHGEPLGLRALAAIALAVLAYGFYTSGVQVARRDTGLDGSLLYLARYAQLLAYFVIAYAFRNHLPHIRGLMCTAAILLGAHVGLNLATGGVSLSAGSSLGFIGILSNTCSGLANALVTLVVLHFLSTYRPKVSAPAIVAAVLIDELLYWRSAYWPQDMVEAGQIWMRLVGLGLLVAACVVKGHATASPYEHPLQYGVALADGSDRDARPLRFLISGPDWVFQVFLAALIPFAYGFVSQMLSTGSMSDGLHDPVSEVGTVILLALLVVCALVRGDRFGFGEMFASVALVYATGFALLVIEWPTASGPGVISSVCLRALISLYDAVLWALLARKSFEDPRHTYLYFGVFLGVANVSYGRLLAPIILNDVPVTSTLVATVSVVFLWLLIVVCLFLFGLQRWSSRKASIRVSEPATKETTSAAAPENSIALDPFIASLNTLCATYGVTAREREVLIETLHGYSMKNAAQNLGISPETVRTHLRNVYAKTGTTSKQELIRLVDELSRDGGSPFVR